MQNFIKISCLFIIVLLNSCNKCEGIACTTAPPSFTLELVDAITGVNLFTTGKYKASNIKVTDELGQNVYTLFNAEDNRNTLAIIAKDKEGMQTLTLTIGKNLSIPIQIKVGFGTSGCCSSYHAEDVAVQGYVTEIVNETGIIKIKI
ncbi:hypothetical protein IWX76_000963 [Pedobacter sp. CAN_A7]|uniref:hypothetical protein n=1 Tax=Pedobacter sp. CAN_A7 TaxID=2787722 RepID=UPI0018CA7908